MSGRPEVELRRLEQADEPAVLDLLTAAMAGGPTGERTAEFFRWKHRNSPFGASPGLVATHHGRIVGVRMFMRWRLTSGAGELRAVRAVDTATHPDHLRQGIFKRLTLTLLEQLDQEEQLDLVFNTPNASSRPGYLRMGWQEVGTFSVHVSPVRPLRFARGVRAASRANASGGADAVAGPPSGSRELTCPLPAALEAVKDEGTLAELVASRRQGTRLRTPLTPEYLRWRYVDAPGLDYRCIPVERGGRVVALGFGRLRRRAGLAEFTLGDVLLRDDDPRHAAALLRAARRSGADHVSTHLAPGSALAGAAARSGYLRVPGNGIRLVANPRGDTPPTVLDAATWQLSLGDLEVF